MAKKMTAEEEKMAAFYRNLQDSLNKNTYTAEKGKGGQANQPTKAPPKQDGGIGAAFRKITDTLRNANRRK